MDRCWLKDSPGDALQAVFCAGDFNIGWLLRAIGRLDQTRPLLAGSALACWFGLAMVDTTSLRRAMGRVHARLARHCHGGFYASPAGVG